MNLMNNFYILLCTLFCGFYFNFLNSGMGNFTSSASFNSSNNNLAPNLNLNLNQNNNQNNFNQNSWDTVSSNVNNIELNNRQFNWQQRKIIKQKSYKIYSNLNVVIEDINDIVDKFSLKINNIKEVVDNFNSVISQKCNELNNNFYQINEFIYYVNFWNDKVNEFKKTIYFTLNKDFRKKIEMEWQNFENIKNMINHYQYSIFKMYSLKDSLINSIDDLYSLQKTAIGYEENAWAKYQQLDELINDNLAESIFLEINNCSDNAILINTYLRGDFLDFFNQGMVNLNRANKYILSAIDDLISHINQTNLFIESLDQEIKIYDEKKQKEKIALEIEERAKIENELKLKELKKQKALQAAEEEKPFYQKIISFLFIYFDIVKNYFLEFYNNIIIKNLNYILNFSKEKFKKPKLKINNNIDNKVLSTEVSSAIANLPPLKDENVNVVLFTSPEPSTGGDKEFINQITTQINQLPNNNNGILPGETMIDDVFSAERLQANNREKLKLGASSYPNKIVPIQQQSSLSNNIQLDINSIPIINTEDIQLPAVNNNAVIEKSSTDKIPFKYQSLESNIVDNKNNDSLLPDLSNLARQRVVAASTVGIESGMVNQVFVPMGNTIQSKASKGRKREKNKKNKKNKKDVKNLKED